MDNNIKFTRNLVKGKIAETIFAEMLRATHEFTVLEFGYEKIIPQIIGVRGEEETVETLRTAPDFAVINHVTKEVHLIEVKYLRVMNLEYVFNYAKRMSESWNPSYLFIASSDGFYFDEVKKICDNRGVISPFKHPQITEEIQEQYHKILRDFELGN